MTEDIQEICYIPSVADTPIAQPRGHLSNTKSYSGIWKKGLKEENTYTDFVPKLNWHQK